MTKTNIAVSTVACESESEREYGKKAPYNWYNPFLIRTNRHVC